MKNALIMLVVGAAIFIAAPAGAVQFTVEARVMCPASIIPTPTGPVADPDFKSVRDVPCAGVRVVAMDADTLFDEFCGAGFTNSTGHVSFPADCSDLLGNGPQVYLRVEARSFHGFSVGTHDIGFFDAVWRVATRGLLTVWDYLRSHETFVWVTGERNWGRSAGATYDGGVIRIGEGFDGGGDVSQMAARQFWAAQYSMSRIRAGTRYPLMDFNYTVDAPMGWPTTLWETILVDSENITGSKAQHTLFLTPHEIGHVLYNSHHSGLLHWFTDATDYMTRHAQCQDGHPMTQAWYEGFANFIGDYVFQRWDWPKGDWTVSRPYGGCAHNTPKLVDMHWEGNVQAFLNNIFFGPVIPEVSAPPPATLTCGSGFTRVTRPDGSIRCEGDRYTPSCPDGHRLIVDGSETADMCETSIEFPMFGTLRAQYPIPCRSGDADDRKKGNDECIATQRPSAPGLVGASAPRSDGSPDLARGLTRTGSKQYFALPSLDQVIEWIIDGAAAGLVGGSHRAGEFWATQIRPWCERTRDADGRAQYCHPTESPGFIDELRLLDPSLP